jgi:Zn finger protein HypA/HybF involved in hydrogenase expression
MHELTVAASLFEWALGQARELAPRRLIAIELEQNPLSGLNSDSVDFGFRALSAESGLREVKLLFVPVDPSYLCAGCGHSLRAASAPSRCPACGGGPPRLSREDSLRVRSIEVDE